MLIDLDRTVIVDIMLLRQCILCLIFVVFCLFSEQTEIFQLLMKHKVNFSDLNFTVLFA